MRERVLITGASGFVGYHLIAEALRNNLEVYAAVRKSSKVDHLKEFDINYTYTDFSSVEALAQEINNNKYDYIVHAAGVTKAKTQDDYNKVNAGYTINLAEAAVMSGRIKKFVFISSLAAAGPLNDLTGTICEQNANQPVTAYGKSKLLAEEKLKDFKNLNYVILRPTAVYGPREKDILIVLKQFAKGFEPYIGKGAQNLSFIYVKDLAQATFKALHNGYQTTYHLSDGNVYDRYQLANITKQQLSVSTFKIHLPVGLIKLVAAVAEGVSMITKKVPALNIEKLNELTAVNWACCITAAQKDLNYKPQYNLQSGLEETLNWYKANKWL